MTAETPPAKTRAGRKDRKEKPSRRTRPEQTSRNHDQTGTDSQDLQQRFAVARTQRHRPGSRTRRTGVDHGRFGLGQVDDAQHPGHSGQLRQRQLLPGRAADPQSERNAGRRGAQQHDRLHLPVVQPHQLQERHGERGPAALLPGHGPAQTQRPGAGVSRHAGAPGVGLAHAQRDVGRSETARGHRPGADQQAADHPGRRAHGRARQRHLAGGDEPAAQRQHRDGHDHHLRDARAVDRRPDRPHHPSARRSHRFDHLHRPGTMKQANANRTQRTKETTLR